MVITTEADGFRQNGTGGVDGLVNSLQIASPRDLLDQDRCESPGPQLFVDAEKVDFRDFEYLPSNSDFSWYAADGGDQFSGLGDPNANMPLLFPSRRLQRPVIYRLVKVHLHLPHKTNNFQLTHAPIQKGGRVLESETLLGVLHVVVE